MDNYNEEDELQRKGFCQSVVRVIYNQIHTRDGLYLAINGPFGSGKTTVLEFIEKELKVQNENVVVVRFNAWENNLFQDPLIAILYSVINSLSSIKGLDGQVKSVFKNAWDTVISSGKEVLKSKLGIIFRNEQREFYDEIEVFESALIKFRNDLMAAVNKEYKIVVLVDELDRCLPSYAIEILEKIHHLFNIKGVATVIAIDKDQLENTIQTVFGNTTNVCGYLAKFVDYEFNLPNVIGSKDSMLKARLANNENKDVLIDIIKSFDMELREQIKTCDEFILLVDPSLEKYEQLIYMLLLCIKRKDLKYYRKLRELNTSTNIRTRNDMCLLFTKYISELDFYKQLKESAEDSFMRVAVAKSFGRPFMYRSGEPTFGVDNELWTSLSPSEQFDMKNKLVGIIEAIDCMVTFEPLSTGE